ncbi:MAG: cysteine protease StiP family protein [Oscillospiraceae bacterium]
MRSTFQQEDVTILLKDITGLVTPLGTKEREQRIQSGVHYCEMLPIEYEPSEKYLAAFYDALERYAKITAGAVMSAADKIYAKTGCDTVLVSLARAGTPIGVLLKRYIRLKYGADVSHYTISIIRGRGIDKNAMKYILDRHAPQNIRFVDGWTGKGAIQRTLCLAMQDYSGIDPSLAVLSDPANIAGICGTYEDFLIASSCLNSTVSGLMSRTFLRSDIIGENDFHGAMYYGELESKDLTYHFIDRITQEFDVAAKPLLSKAPDRTGMEEVTEIAEKFGIADINLVKPGIGEATRVLLRRVPWKLLVHSTEDNEHLGHIYQLAKEKGVEVEGYPLKNYKACGLIRSIADN